MTPSEELRQVAVLDGYVEDAARQRLYLQGWERDRELLESGGRIVYSVDTDILKLFLDPIDMAASRPAPGGRSRPGYAQIFRHDSPELSIALGSAIAEFIFFPLGERAPLLMLPPLEREVGAVFQAITVQADREHHDALAELDWLRENVTAFAEGIQAMSNDAERLDLIIGEMPNLHKLLFGYSGPSAELAQIAVLLERSPLTDLHRFLSRPHDVHADVVEHLRSLNTIRGWIEFSHLHGRWEERLERTKPKWKPKKNVDADCHALARLEQLNRILDSSRVRVVHVTGDHSIFEAAAIYRLQGNDQSFASLYLRHPRSFLAEPSVLFTESEADLRKAKEVIPWLDVFLARFTGAAAPSSAELLKFLEQTPEDRHASVQRVLKRDPDAGRVFEEEWKQFCGPIALRHVQSTSKGQSSHFEQYLSVLRGWAEGLGKEDMRSFREADAAFEERAKEFDRILDELEEVVAERVLKTWQDCFAAATSTGFSLLRFGSRDGRPARSPLPIMFNKFQKASNFFSEMLTGQHVGRFREMIQDVQHEDETGYVFYLAFGALFGAQGKWRLARILADRALGIAETRPPHMHTEMINGREAYYLRAAARRLTARKVEDFEDAKSDLALARQALKQSHDKNPDHPITALRFDAEEVAIELSRQLFGLFAAESENGSGLSSEWLDSLQERIRDLLAQVDQQLSREVRERVHRALSVNFLTCVFLRTMLLPGNVQPVEIRENDRVVFEDLKQGMIDNGGHVRLEQSYLHRAVLLTARTLLAPPETREDLRKLRGELRAHFEDGAIAANLVTNYDHRRFEFMRDLAGWALDEWSRRRRRPAES